MKFQSVAVVAGISAWVWIAAASPEVSVESAVKVPEKSLDALIHGRDTWTVA